MLSLGSLDVDGRLRQKFELGTLAGSPEFAFPIYLEHGFRAEDPVSEYKVPQLETYAAPEGRDQILWLEPGGLRHLFKKADVLKAVPDKQTAPWVAVEPEPGVMVFRSDDGWTYHYSAGAIRSLKSPAGRELLFDTDGLQVTRIYQKTAGGDLTLLKARESELGQPETLTIGPDVHHFQYDPDTEHLRTWTSPRLGDKPVSFSYDKAGLLQAVVLPGGQKLAYAWDTRQNLQQKNKDLELPLEGPGVFLVRDTDYSFTFGLTRQGIRLFRTDAAGHTEGMVFNPLTQQLTRRSRDGGETTEFYGQRGVTKSRLESVRDARGRESMRITYDDKARVISRQAPGSPPLRFEYDDLDRVTKISRLDEVIKSYVYEGDSEKPVRITDALGNSIQISYDAAGQMTRYKDLDGAVFEFIYDEVGQLVEQRFPLGYKKTIERDSFGRVIRAREMDGRESRYDYTADNRLAKTSNDGVEWSYQYDAEGNFTGLLRDGKAWQKIEREKNAETGGEIVKNINAKGDESVIQLDSKGNMVKEIDPLGQKTQYKRDALGQLAGWEDGRGSTVDLQRDPLGRISGVDTGGGPGIKMTYDQTGRLRERKTGEQDIRYDYDKEGRLVKIDYGKGQTVDYTYDRYGRVDTALTGQGVKTTYTWDVLDRKASERNDIPGIGSTLLKWTYTPSGRTKTVTVYKNGDDEAHRLQETGYLYDALGRYEQMTVNGEPKVWYEYDKASLKLTLKRFFNGWTVRYETYPAGYPKSLVAKDDKGKVIKDVGYVWNAEGKLEKRTMDGVLQEYRYDSLGRLTEVIKTSPTENTKPDRSTSKADS
ncbi:hypothetical protein ACFQ5Q_10265 [Luteolibacter ambystomatis]|uniref:hypothetical protein n=1 Tax=Luteolibacter ambystomatis TaxID=2824561 RepID=UPI003636A032